MKRLLRFTVFCGGILLVVVFLLQVTAAGRVLTTRTFVRAERLWSRDFPIAAARGWVRKLDAPLAAVGLIRPVRVEIEPGVSLLLDPEDDIGRTVLTSRTGQWEPEVWSALGSHLSPGAVFIDVGAHIGIDSLKASRVVGPSGQVIAVEPNPTTLGELNANIDASKATNVRVQPIALSDVEQELTLFDARRRGNSGSSSLSARNAGDEGVAYKVRGRKLDDVVAELKLTRIDLIKADIEGAELMALRGAAHTLATFHPPLVLEVVPRQLENMGASVEELEAFIRSLGYNRDRWVDYKNKEYIVVK